MSDEELILQYDQKFWELVYDKGYSYRKARRILKKKYPSVYYDVQKDKWFINNVVMGTAIFPNPKKYYVQLIKGDEYSYLNINSEGGAELGTKFGFGHWKTKFTIDEVAAMNPQLVLFMEEVEK